MAGFSTSPVSIRFGLRHQLLAAMGLLVALLIIVAGASLLSLWEIDSQARQTFEVEGELNRLANEVAFLSQQCRLNEREVFLAFDRPMVRDSYIIQWQSTTSDLDAAIRAFDRAALTPADHQQAEEWSRAFNAYQTAVRGLHQSIKDGTLATTDAAITAGALTNANILPLMATANTTAEAKERRAQRAEVDLLNYTTQRMWLLFAIAGLACLVAVLWAVYFPIRLMRPIAALQAATSRLASGELTARTNLQRDDELGVLSHHFDRMAATIQQRTADLEAQHAQATAARVEADAARAAISEQLATIAEQRHVIREMSVPVLPLSETALLLPLVGALDSERLQLVQEQALHALEQSTAQHLILDITGVPVIDTAVAQGLITTVEAARLLGTDVMLVGIRPEVAQAVVALGINLNTITTRSTLQTGIAYVLRRNERVETRV